MKSEFIIFEPWYLFFASNDFTSICVWCQQQQCWNGKREEEGHNTEPLQWLKTICFDVIYSLTRVLMMLEDSLCKWEKLYCLSRPEVRRLQRGQWFLLLALFYDGNEKEREREKEKKQEPFFKVSKKVSPSVVYGFSLKPSWEVLGNSLRAFELFWRFFLFQKSSHDSLRKNFSNVFYAKKFHQFSARFSRRN